MSDGRTRCRGFLRTIAELANTLACPAVKAGSTVMMIHRDLDYAETAGRLALDLVAQAQKTGRA